MNSAFTACKTAQLDLFQGTSYMGASLGTRFLLANSAVENMQ